MLKSKGFNISISLFLCLTFFPSPSPSPFLVIRGNVLQAKNMLLTTFSFTLVLTVLTPNAKPLTPRNRCMCEAWQYVFSSAPVIGEVTHPKVAQYLVVIVVVVVASPWLGVSSQSSICAILPSHTVDTISLSCVVQHVHSR